nr:hypothetical protein CFP56_54447 [Quercus suber]
MVSCGIFEPAGLLVHDEVVPHPSQRLISGHQSIDWALGAVLKGASKSISAPARGLLPIWLVETAVVFDANLISHRRASLQLSQFIFLCTGSHDTSTVMSSKGLTARWKSPVRIASLTTFTSLRVS